MQRDKDEPMYYPHNYSTDLVSDKAVHFLDHAIDAQKPFFLAVTPVGPHSESAPDGFSHPVPAHRHEHMFPGLKAPRTSNFNPDVVSIFQNNIARTE